MIFSTSYLKFSSLLTRPLILPCKMEKTTTQFLGSNPEPFFSVFFEISLVTTLLECLVDVYYCRENLLMLVYVHVCLCPPVTMVWKEALTCKCRAFESKSHPLVNQGSQWKPATRENLPAVSTKVACFEMDRNHFKI